MLTLPDGMILYHGSYIAVPEVNLKKCNDGLDFGKGFYVTSSYAQARSFIVNSVRRNIRAGIIPPDFDVNDGQISVYKFHLSNELLIHIFPDADLDWLHFVAANRNRTLFQELYLAGYVTGLFGVPGSELADDFAIRSLLPNRLEDQFCFRTEKALNYLEFIRSDRYGDV